MHFHLPHRDHHHHHHHHRLFHHEDTSIGAALRMTHRVASAPIDAQQGDTPISSHPDEPQTPDAQDKASIEIEMSEEVFDIEQAQRHAERQACWDGFRCLFGILKRVSGVFGPLESAVGGLDALLELYDQANRNLVWVARLLTRINRLLNFLGRRLEHDKDEVKSFMTKGYILDLIRTARALHGMRNRGLFARIVSGSPDEGMLKEQCDRLADSIQELQLEIGLSIEKTATAILEAMELRSLHRATAAAYTANTSSANIYRRSCVEGTREDILNDLLMWALEDAPNAKPVCWMSGLAGQGKTTIAYTLCEQLERQAPIAHLQFVSYFCSRKLDTHKECLLVSTLVLALAEKNSSFATELVQAIRNQHDLGDQSLDVQLKRLLVEPWRKSTQSREGLRPIIVVLDGLDEHDAGGIFVSGLLDAIEAKHLVGLRFLLASRPDTVFSTSLRGHDIFRMDLNPAPDSELSVAVDQDILKYLRVELRPHGDTEGLLEDLAASVGGLFIYAATAARLVRPDVNRLRMTRGEEEKEIRQIIAASRRSQEVAGQIRHIAGGSSGSAVQFPEGRAPILDEFYAKALGLSFQGLTPVQRAARRHVVLVMAIVSRLHTINIDLLSALSGKDVELVRMTLLSLQAFVCWDPDDSKSPLSSYHASFDEHILTENAARMQATYFEVVQHCWKNVLSEGFQTPHNLLASSLPNPRSPWVLEEKDVTAADFEYTVQLVITRARLEPFLMVVHGPLTFNRLFRDWAPAERPVIPHAIADWAGDVGRSVREVLHETSRTGSNILGLAH